MQLVTTLSVVPSQRITTGSLIKTQRDWKDGTHLSFGASSDDDDGHNDGDIHLSDMGGESDRGGSDGGSQSDYEEDLLEEEEWLGVVQWGELLSQHLVTREVSFTTSIFTSSPAFEKQFFLLNPCYALLQEAEKASPPAQQHFASL
ncbi:hypothetical protein V8E54_000543 [Elaphomyces granulatus]